MTSATNETANFLSILSLPDIGFLVFAVLILGCGAIVVFSRNIVHSGFSLLGTFTGVAGLYALLSADFLAAAQILVYVGGVLIIILFAIMLTRGIQAVDVSNPSIGIVPSVFLGLTITALLGFIAFSYPWKTVSPTETVSSVRAIGDALLSRYLIPFEVLSVLLLAALIGSVMLVRKEIGRADGEGDES
jgi:NAD(P)H-quinone oxidoreductase subunit 6